MNQYSKNLYNFDISQEALSRALVVIRRIASLGGRGGDSVDPRDPIDKLKAIARIADAIHNLPEKDMRPACLVDLGLADLANVGRDLYGKQSPFEFSGKPENGTLYELMKITKSDDDYSVIDIPNSAAEEYGVDVRVPAEFELEDESEADHG